MSAILTKSQKQDLGNMLQAAGYDPKEFVYTEVEGVEVATGVKGKGSAATLTNRKTSDKFTVIVLANGFTIVESVPGTLQGKTYTGLDWETVASFLSDWATRVKTESEAIDPWQQEAEAMAADDSYFGLEELTQVDKAIQESLDELKKQALEHGVSQDRIEAALEETGALLKKSARNSTKKEWLAIFKSVIVEKLVDWGMETLIFQTILHTLITSGHQIAQLAEHAARHMPT